MLTRRITGRWILSLALVFGWTLAGEAVSPTTESRAALRHRAGRSERLPVARLDESTVHLAPRSPPLSLH
jgi:hypothetical protein